METKNFIIWRRSTGRPGAGFKFVCEAGAAVNTSLPATVTPLVCCPRRVGHYFFEFSAVARDFFQDGGSLGTPDIALWLAVAFGQPVFAGAHQFRHALEADVIESSRFSY